MAWPTLHVLCAPTGAGGRQVRTQQVAQEVDLGGVGPTAAPACKPALLSQSALTAAALLRITLIYPVTIQCSASLATSASPHYNSSTTMCAAP